MNCTKRMITVCGMGLGVALAAMGVDAQPPAAPAKAPESPALRIVAGADAKPFQQEVPSAAFKFEMIPVPANPEKNIKPFWIGKTELTWEAFDVYIYRLDEPKPADGKADPRDGSSQGAAPPDASSPPTTTGADAITRPSKPYLPPDRGFGHEGFAAIGMSLNNAREFCKWLSVKTGRHYRLPTEAEWEHACLAGSKGPYCFGSDAAKLLDYAWFAGDADDSPHGVGKKKANAWGLHDMHGNVGEWCETADGKGVLKGGSYLSSADEEAATARQAPDRAWNASDPQVPKSKWWLANGPFVGFRVVCDSDVVLDAGKKNDSKGEAKPSGSK